MTQVNNFVENGGRLCRTLAQSVSVHVDPNARKKIHKIFRFFREVTPGRAVKLGLAHPTVVGLRGGAPFRSSAPPLEPALWLCALPVIQLVALRNHCCRDHKATSFYHLSHRSIDMYGQIYVCTAPPRILEPSH